MKWIATNYYTGRTLEIETYNHPSLTFEEWLVCSEIPGVTSYMPGNHSWGPLEISVTDGQLLQAAAFDPPSDPAFVPPYGTIPNCFGLKSEEMAGSNYHIESAFLSADLRKMYFRSAVQVRNSDQLPRSK